MERGLLKMEQTLKQIKDISELPKDPYWYRLAITVTSGVS